MPVSAAIVNVPAEYPTIQEGIDACLDGDTVMVAEGIYSGPGNREITTAGKAIVVMGGEGAINTIIDGEGTYTGFRIDNQEQSTTVIEGFTIRNVSSGIQCELTSPTIRANIIENFISNGIYLEADYGDQSTSPVVENCIFTQTDPIYVGRGNGIYVYRRVEATISGCKFINCRCGLDFYANANMWPVFQVMDCVFRGNSLYGIWIHS
jgi:nitrous oxidase accessory protein NosD